MNIRFTLSVLMIAGVVGAAVADPTDVHLVLKSLYKTTQLSLPFRATILNEGAAVSGTLTLTSFERTVSFPISVPAHSTLSRTIYPSSIADRLYGQRFDGQVRLDTDRGAIKQEFKRRDDYAPIRDEAHIGPYLEIGDGASVRPKDKEIFNGNKYVALLMRVKAEDATSRTGDYIGCRGIILMPGAERMSDDAFNAVTEFAEQGGRVVISGGSSSPYLKDVRLAKLLPLKFGAPQRAALQSLFGKNPFASTPVLEVIPVIQAPGWKQRQGDNPRVVTSIVYGKGRLIFAGVDLDLAEHAPDTSLVSLFEFSWHRAQYSGRVSYPEPTFPYGSQPPSEARMPFNVPIPTTASIGWILAAFLVLAVPINFYVLQRLGKREWAWFTAPAMSFAFTAVMLTKAGALYSVPTSCATEAVIIAEEGQPFARVEGATTVFFHDSKAYRLELGGADTATALDQNYWRGRAPDQNFHSPFQILDDGKLTIEAQRPASLSIHTLSFTGRVENRLVDVAMTPDGYRVTALARISSAKLVTTRGFYDLGDLKPGESRSLFAKHPTNVFTYLASSSDSDQPPFFLQTEVPFDVMLSRRSLVTHFSNEVMVRGRMFVSAKPDENFDQAIVIASDGNVVVCGTVDLKVGPSVGLRIGPSPKFIYVARNKP